VQRDNRPTTGRIADVLGGEYSATRLSSTLPCCRIGFEAAIGISAARRKSTPNATARKSRSVSRAGVGLICALTVAGDEPQQALQLEGLEKADHHQFLPGASRHFDSGILRLASCARDVEREPQPQIVTKMQSHFGRKPSGVSRNRPRGKQAGTPEDSTMLVFFKTS
jgi:hypothetical protein